MCNLVVAGARYGHVIYYGVHTIRLFTVLRRRSLAMMAMLMTMEVRAMEERETGNIARMRSPSKLTKSQRNHTHTYRCGKPTNKNKNKNTKIVMDVHDAE